MSILYPTSGLGPSRLGPFGSPKFSVQFLVVGHIGSPQRVFTWAAAIIGFPFFRA